MFIGSIYLISMIVVKASIYSWANLMRTNGFLWVVKDLSSLVSFGTVLTNIVVADIVWSLVICCWTD